MEYFTLVPEIYENVLSYLKPIDCKNLLNTTLNLRYNKRLRNLFIFGKLRVNQSFQFCKKDLELLYNLYQPGISCTEKLIHKFLQKKDSDTVIWMYKCRKIVDLMFLINSSVEYGIYNLFIFFVNENRNANFSSSLLKLACIDGGSSKGGILITKWILKNTGVKLNRNIICNIIRSGHLKLLKWIVKSKSFDIQSTFYFYIAVECGQLKIVKWLYLYFTNTNAIDPEIIEDSANVAYHFGHMNVFNWLLSKFGD